jgi:hypothetical protein
VSAEWRSIAEFPDYDVSSDGDVRRSKYAARNTKIGHILKPFRSASGSGYLTVSLCDGKTAHKRSIHRLVCTAFHGFPPSTELHAAHEDGDRLNNRADNLSWKQPAANMADKLRHGTHNRGERHKRSILSNVDADAVRNAVGRRGLGRELAERFGVSQSLISMIRAGKHRPQQGVN